MIVLILFRKDFVLCTKCQPNTMTFFFQNNLHPVFLYIFTFFLLEMRPMFLTSSIFITVIMAKQRYDAIKHPVEYHSNNVHSNKKKRALKWIAIIQLTALIVSIPLFLEPTVVDVTHQMRSNLNATHMALVSLFDVSHMKIRNFPSKRKC